MTVIQTGAIAAVGVRVRGLRLRDLPALEDNSSAIYAALGVGGANAAQFRRHRRIEDAAERSCRSCCSPGLLFIAVGGLMGQRPPPGRRRRPAAARFGLAMIFVLLTYGGWNEAAYLAGEVRDPPPQHDAHPGRRASSQSPCCTLLVNLGYLAALGPGEA